MLSCDMLDGHSFALVGFLWFKIFTRLSDVALHTRIMKGGNPGRKGCNIHVTAIMADIAQGKLQSVRKGLTRFAVGRQMGNIRRNLQLRKKGWTAEADRLLRDWVQSAKRKLDKRSSGCLPQMSDGSSIARPGMTLDRWLRDKGVRGVGLTGHVVSAGRVPLLKEIMKLKSATETCTIVQTGFNAGHSADVILSFRPTAKLISFQKLASLGTDTRKMNQQGVRFISDKFPGRHTIIWGDSQKTLPRFAKQYNTVGRFVDVAFIDGGHSKVCCLSDIKNVQCIMRPNGILIVDDVVLGKGKSWELGPSAAWRECVRIGVVRQLGCRGHMAWGRILH